MNSPKYISPPQTYQPSEPSLTGKLQEVPHGLLDIQPCLSQVCDCKNIGFDINGNWKLWYASISSSRVKGCGGTILVREHHYSAHRSYLPALDGRCFIPSAVVHHNIHYNQDIPYNITNVFREIV